MSKEFEQALEGLPTMSQFMFKEHCEEERLKHMFTAGRALGRREVKGEAVSVIENMREDGNCRHSDIADAIEAIPEEV